MVVLEAYGLGVPVVASDIGSLQEIVEEGVTGIKFKPANPQDLADKVNSLKSNVGLLATMKLNAKNLYQQKYTAVQNFKQLMAIYEQVIAEQKGA